MKYQSILWACIFLLASNTLDAQTWFNAYDVFTFQDYPGDVVQTQDGGYVMVYQKADDIEVVKTDIFGETQWRKSLDYIDVWGSGYDYHPQIECFDDGTLLIASNTRSTYPICGSSVAYWRLTLSGEIVKTSVIEEMEIHDMIKTSSGGFVFAGIFRYIESSFCKNRSGIVLLDSEATIITTASPYWLSGSLTISYAVTEVHTGEFVVLSGTREWTGTYWERDHFLDRYSYNGFFEGSVYIDHNIDPDLFNTDLVSIHSSDEVLASVKVAYKRHSIQRLGINGNDIWETSLDDFDAPVMTRMNDYQYMVAGIENNSIVLYKFWVGVGSEYYYDQVNIIPIPLIAEQHILTEIIHSSDKGFLISGSSGKFSGDSTRMFLMKLDSLGQFNGTLHGHVREDLNSDCIAQSGEPPLSNWIVEANGPNGTFYASTDSTGSYHFSISPGNYTIRFLYPGSVYWSVCNSDTVITIANTEDIVTFNGSLQVIVSCPLTDVEISVNRLRPCRDIEYSIMYCNYGTATAENATINLTLDEYITFVEANVPTTLQDDTIHMEIGDILPGECGFIKVKVSIDCDAPLGFSQCVSTSISPATFCLQGSPPPGILFLDTECRVVSGAIDPNDKTAEPEGTGPKQKIPVDTTLTYMIRFQNTGNDTAFSVVLLDTLPDELDIATFQPGAASHAYEWELLGDRILRFTFPGILLPDSNVNESASHGFVTYQLHPDQSIIPGAEIKNSASIYFDFNAPVKTNTTLHTIQKPVYTGEDSINICYGDPLNGVKIISDTMVMKLLTFALYDSLVTVNVSVVNPVHSVFSDSFCEGDVYPIGDKVYGLPGVYEVALTGVNGCDSIVTLTLNVLPSSEAHPYINLCRGEMSPLTGQIFHDPGVYHSPPEVLLNSVGCDSVVFVTHHVHPEELVITDTLIPYGNYYHGIQILKDTQFISHDTTLFGCPLIFQEYVYVLITSLDQLSNHMQMTVYPNPFQKDLIISFDLPEGMMTDAQILDPLGQTVAVLWKNELIPSGRSTFAIEALSLPRGTFLLFVRSEKNHVVCRITRM